jgi:hypothetical protein
MGISEVNELRPSPRVPGELKAATIYETFSGSSGAESMEELPNLAYTAA